MWIYILAKWLAEMVKNANLCGGLERRERGVKAL